MNGIVQRIHTPGPTLAAMKRFGRYKREQPKATKGPDMAEDVMMRKALEFWRTFDCHRTADSLFREFDLLDFSAEDVQRFCVIAKDFADERLFPFKLGVVLNRMMENSSRMRFELSLGHLDARLEHLCASNRKDVVVRGNVGTELGTKMRGGTILLDGGATKNVGSGMEGGQITIHGDVRAPDSLEEMGVGAEMRGGKITVDGDVCGFVGYLMSGGEIRINGDIFLDGQRHLASIEEAVGFVEGGKVYHKGKLIVDR